METTRVRIDENHILDIIDGAKLEEQPYEAQEVYNNYIDENSILPFWARNAKEFDNHKRPTAWHYEWGELVVDILITYKFDEARDWSPASQFVKLSKLKSNV